MKQNEYPVAPFSNETYLLGYEASNPKLTRNYLASDISGSGGLNIFNSNGSLPTGTSRLFDLDTGSLKLLNGKLYLNTTGFTGGSFQMEILSSSSALIISSQSTGINISGASGTCLSLAGTNIGLLSSTPRNVIQTSGSIPAAVPSSVFDVNSTTQGSRPAPPMTKAQREAIVSPADFLEVTQTDTVGPSLFGKYIYIPGSGWDRIKLASE